MRAMVPMDPSDGLREGLSEVPSRCLRIDGPARDAEDVVAVEEPLEIRVRDRALATIMRTPGRERDLVLGFLYAEGWIDSLASVGALAFCGRSEAGGAGQDHLRRNVVSFLPAAGHDPPFEVVERSPLFSSCGVCGKRTIEEALRLRPPPARPRPPAGWLDPTLLLGLPARLRECQPLFARCGALHAAAFFDADGRLLAAAEDIGRHNAVDKALGRALYEGRIPGEASILFVSGRASFEIVQKAYRAGAWAVGAVSGVSSLAERLASECGILLAGFVRAGGFRAYGDRSHLKA